jgi:hypothetical protein
VGDSVDEQTRILLTEGHRAVAGATLRVRSATVEWFTRDGKDVPRVTLVLEPEESG